MATMSRDSSTTHITDESRRSSSADRAQLAVGDVPAAHAEAHPGLGLGDRRGQPGDVVARRLQQVEGDPLRRLRTDAREPAELVDQRLDGLGVDRGHQRSSSSCEPGNACSSRSTGPTTDSGGTSVSWLRSMSSSASGPRRRRVRAHQQRATAVPPGTLARRPGRGAHRHDRARRVARRRTVAEEALRIVGRAVDDQQHRHRDRRRLERARPRPRRRAPADRPGALRSAHRARDAVALADHLHRREHRPGQAAQRRQHLGPPGDAPWRRALAEPGASVRERPAASADLDAGSRGWRRPRRPVTNWTPHRAPFDELAGARASRRAGGAARRSIGPVVSSARRTRPPSRARPVVGSTGGAARGRRRADAAAPPAPDCTACSRRSRRDRITELSLCSASWVSCTRATSSSRRGSGA